MFLMAGEAPTVRKRSEQRESGCLLLSRFICKFLRTEGKLVCPRGRACLGFKRTRKTQQKAEKVPQRVREHIGCGYL